MNERERQSKHKESNFEYSFEAGLEEILHRIEDLLVIQDYVVVTVHGSQNAGKTFLSHKLGKELIKRGIKIHWQGCNIDRFGDVPVSLHPKSVILFGATSIGFSVPKEKVDKVLQAHDRILQEQAEKIGLSLQHIDIKVAIYSPRRPFEIDNDSVMTADIIIRNDQAGEK